MHSRIAVVCILFRASARSQLATTLFAVNRYVPVVLTSLIRGSAKPALPIIPQGHELTRKAKSTFLLQTKDLADFSCLCLLRQTAQSSCLNSGPKRWKVQTSRRANTWASATTAASKINTYSSLIWGYHDLYIKLNSLNISNLKVPQVCWSAIC